MANIDNISTIIFDLDDTLIPSSLAYEQALNNLGYPGNHSDYLAARAKVKSRLPRGHTSARNRLLYFKALLEEKGQFSAKTLLELTDHYESQLSTIFKRSWSDEKSQLLKKLKAKFKLIVLTNENLRTQMIKLNAIDPENIFFDTFITSEEIGCEKPNPKAFGFATNAAGCAPDQILMVGDNLEHDIHPALKLGLRAGWMSEYTKADPKSVTIPEGVYTFNSLAELTAALL